MKFSEVVDQARVLLQRTGKITYRVLKREFALDDEALEDLKEQFILAEGIAVDQGGKMLVWTGTSPVTSSEFQVSSAQPPAPSPQHPTVLSSQSSVASPQPPNVSRSTLHASRAEGERRQLTGMFCDLVDSTALSERLDPEEWREVVRAYQQTGAAVIDHYEGHIAQYLGDGLLVYFGYPNAHEDDAQRAVRAALGVVEAIQRLSFPTIQLPRPVQVRIGIHTGLVVVGEIGGSEKHETLALGETPNVAARLQGLAEPDTVVISTATYRLIEGLFDCRDLGVHSVKGVSTPLQIYQVIGESGIRSRLEAAATRGLTPLVGREEEIGLLRKRWEQNKAGTGQVVLLSGEAGIGKSRLVQTLKEQVAQEMSVRVEYRCSPYYQNSAFYPVIDHLQRLLQFTREDSPEDKVRKLEAVVAGRALRAVPLQPEVIPLFAALLSLPLPAHYPPLTLTPQRQKQKTLEALVAWLVKEAERQPVLVVVEDTHWVDPSTLEFLSFLLDQVPTTRLLLLLTFRPDFTPPWAMFSYITHLTLSRLAHRQVEVMVEKVTGGKSLPTEVIQQLVTKTDGVPLFVEELTKTILESVEAKESIGSGGRLDRSAIPLGIPATLQDALMARLDRLGTAKEAAQVGAVLGREFSYELLHAVSPLDEETLQQGLRQLVEAELIYQRGLPPQVVYFFKHALIQDTAYQSLLKSTRQQYHRQIAQVLEARFTETPEIHPELVAQHYTEAGLSAQAIPFWQMAGERAAQRSAYVEAIVHCTKGLELLQPLPDTPERTYQELRLQLALAPPLMATTGYSTLEVERVYTRALELCRQLGETPKLFWALLGLYAFNFMRAELKTARELGEQCLSLAQNTHNPIFLVWAHYVLGNTLFWLGEFALAREHLEEGIALYDSQQHRSYGPLIG